LDKLNDELKDVTKVMTKNIEDLLYRGDSLERMGDISSRLREDSRKYKKAAVRINWELLLKQVRCVLLHSHTRGRAGMLTICSTDQLADWLSS
jgi:C4-dicarboxylate-specific signal transduction histidine kinase